MPEKTLFESNKIQYYSTKIKKWIVGTIRITKNYIYLSYRSQWLPVFLKNVVNVDDHDEKTLVLDVEDVDGGYSLFITTTKKELDKIKKYVKKLKKKKYSFVKVYRVMLIIFLITSGTYLAFEYLIPAINTFFNPPLNLTRYENLTYRDAEFLTNFFITNSNIFNDSISSTITFNSSSYNDSVSCEKYLMQGGGEEFKIIKCKNITLSKEYYDLLVKEKKSLSEDNETMYCKEEEICRDQEIFLCMITTGDSLLTEYYWTNTNYTFISNGEEGINLFQKLYCVKKEI